MRGVKPGHDECAEYYRFAASFRSVAVHEISSV
jgi:hypothetical protein